MTKGVAYPVNEVVNKDTSAILPESKENEASTQSSMIYSITELLRQRPPKYVNRIPSDQAISSTTTQGVDDRLRIVLAERETGRLPEVPRGARQTISGIPVCPAVQKTKQGVRQTLPEICIPAASLDPSAIAAGCKPSNNKSNEPPVPPLTVGKTSKDQASSFSSVSEFHAASRHNFWPADYITDCHYPSRFPAYPASQQLPTNNQPSLPYPTQLTELQQSSSAVGGYLRRWDARPPETGSLPLPDFSNVAPNLPTHPSLDSSPTPLNGLLDALRSVMSPNAVINVLTDSESPGNTHQLSSSHQHVPPQQQNIQPNNFVNPVKMQQQMQQQPHRQIQTPGLTQNFGGVLFSDFGQPSEPSYGAMPQLASYAPTPFYPTSTPYTTQDRHARISYANGFRDFPKDEKALHLPNALYPEFPTSSPSGPSAYIPYRGRYDNPLSPFGSNRNVQNASTHPSTIMASALLASRGAGVLGRDMI